MEKENCIVKHQPTWSSWSVSQDITPNLVIELKEVRKATKYYQTSAARVDLIILERMGLTTK